MRVLPLLVLMAAQPPPPPALDAQVLAAIAATGAEAAVAWRTLDGADELLIDADESFHAASTMKVAVMIELYAQAHAGRLALDEPLTVTNVFRSIVDGTEYQLSVKDDSDETLYRSLGQRKTLAELCRAMIVVSSNLATNLLVERLGVDNIRQTVARLGAGGLDVRRGVEDGKAYAAGRNNTTTARALLVLFERLARGEAVTPAADREMLDILAAQSFREGIPAGVPAGTKVAHKTGSITRIHHDAGIVYASRPYVLVVLVGGLEDRGRSAALIADISRLVHDAARLRPRGSVVRSPQNEDRP